MDDAEIRHNVLVCQLMALRGGDFPARPQVMGLDKVASMTRGGGPGVVIVQ